MAFYPISLGRGLSLAFHLFRFGWRTFVAINVVAFLPVAVISGVVAYATQDAIVDWQRLVLANATTAAGSTDLISAAPWSAYVLIILSGFVVVPFSALGAGALIHAIAAAIAGQRLSARASFSTAIGRFWSLLALSLVLAVPGTALGLLGFVLPMLRLAPTAFNISGGPLALLGLVLFVAVLFGAVFAVICIAFATQSLVIEHLSVADALRRSWRLLAGSMLRFVGWAFVFGLIIGLIGIAIGIPVGIAALIISPPRLTDLSSLGSFSATAVLFETLLTTILGAIIEPIVVIGLTLLYFDVRWRHGEDVPVPGRRPLGDTAQTQPGGYTAGGGPSR